MCLTIKKCIKNFPAIAELSFTHIHIRESYFINFPNFGNYVIKRMFAEYGGVCVYAKEFYMQHEAAKYFII